jgi:uncharacterized protein YkwD
MRAIIFIFFIGFVTFTHAQTAREMEMVRVINTFRADPKSAIPLINQYLVLWDSDASERAAANELIRELNKTKPMDTLSFCPDLYKLAKEHGDWMKRTNRFQHSKYRFAENLVAGNEDVTMAVIDLLIDDGVPDRGHRKNLLNKDLKQVACYEIPGEVAKQGFNFVQIFK